MPSVTPGQWSGYFSGPIFSSASVTVLLVPGGRTFYVDYLTFTTYNTIPDLCALLLVCDGTPVLTLTSDRFSAQQFFPRPLVVSNIITMQPLGTLDAAKNMVVSWVGSML